MKKEYADYLLNKIREDYDKIAKDFSDTRYSVWEELNIFKDYIKDGDRVLDLGCGNGRLLELFRDNNIDYIGVDNSEKLIKIAKEKSNIQYSISNTQFLVADALNLPFPNNSFDKIFAIAVLHHIPSKEYRLQFLREAKRVLRPGGFLVITCWKFHQPKELFLIFKFTISKLVGISKLDFGDIFEPWGKKIKRYYHYFSKKELMNLVNSASFKIKNIGVVKNKRGNRQNVYIIVEK